MVWAGKSGSKKKKYSNTSMRAATQASVSRLNFALLLIAVVFVALKLLNIVDWHWVIVLSPLIVFFSAARGLLLLLPGVLIFLKLFGWIDWSWWTVLLSAVLLPFVYILIEMLIKAAICALIYVVLRGILLIRGSFKVNIDGLQITLPSYYKKIESLSINSPEFTAEYYSIPKTGGYLSISVKPIPAVLSDPDYSCLQIEVENWLSAIRDEVLCGEVSSIDSIKIKDYEGFTGGIEHYDSDSLLRENSITEADTIVSFLVERMVVTIYCKNDIVEYWLGNPDAIRIAKTVKPL